MFNGFEDVQKAGQESVSRAVQSFGAMSKGLQAIAGEAADYSKRSFESGAAHVETLMQVRSLDRAVEVQTEFLRSAYEDAVGQANRLGELYVELARNAVKPYEGFLPVAR